LCRLTVALDQGSKTHSIGFDETLGLKSLANNTHHEVDGLLRGVLGQTGSTSLFISAMSNVLDKQHPLQIQNWEEFAGFIDRLVQYTIHATEVLKQLNPSGQGQTCSGIVRGQGADQMSKQRLVKWRRYVVDVHIGWYLKVKVIHGR